MLLKIAWRNIWRSRGRSFVVMGAVVVGIWAIIAGSGFMNGFVVSYTTNVIKNDVSNLQVHHPEFKNDYEIKYGVPNGVAKADELRAWEGIQAATTRSIVNGMIATPRKAAGVQIRGIDLENEALVTNLDSLVIDGKYFEGISRNPVLIGKKLAENLGAKVRSKVVLTFSDINGNITAAAFRVAGIVNSSSLNIKELYAFVKQEDLNKLLGIGVKIHEIAVLTQPQLDEKLITQKYSKIHPEDLTETWKEVEPGLALYESMTANMLLVLMGIILMALAFGIINTMLMAVLERTRELGMLMAVGMSKVRVFFMVVIETVFLCLIGAPVGLFLGKWMIDYYKEVGVNLSNYSEGLETFGFNPIVYPYIEDQVYLLVTLGVAFTAVIGALYPAWKAVKLRPVEALHKI